MKDKKGPNVVAIILIVVAVFFVVGMFLPAFFQAREKARQADCISNLSRIGKVSFMYAVENRDWYPTVRKYQTDFEDNPIDGGIWLASDSYRAFTLMRDLEEYLGGPKSLVCPSQDKVDPASGNESLSGHVSYNWCDGLKGGNSTMSAVCADAWDNHKATGRFLRGDGSVDVAYGAQTANGGKGWQGDSKFDKFANAGGTRQWIIGK